MNQEPCPGMAIIFSQKKVNFGVHFISIGQQKCNFYAWMHILCILHLFILIHCQHHTQEQLIILHTVQLYIIDTALVKKINCKLS
jgi:hypothetical protein